MDADGGCDSAVTASQICLEKVVNLKTRTSSCPPILTRKGLSLKLKGKVYATCVSCLMHGSETWPMKVEHELKMNRTEMSMVSQMDVWS